MKEKVDVDDGKVKDSGVAGITIEGNVGDESKEKDEEGRQ